MYLHTYTCSHVIGTSGCCVPKYCGCDVCGIVFPSVIDDTPDQLVTTGLNVTFNCIAEGSDDISYRWNRTEPGSLVERPFNTVFTSRVFGEATPTLTILNVGVEDQGEYTCFVSVSDTLVGTRTACLTTRGEYQWDDNW